MVLGQSEETLPAYGQTADRTKTPIEVIGALGRSAGKGSPQVERKLPLLP